jgi:hypothetical protein
MKPTTQRIGNFREKAYGNLPTWLNIGMNHMSSGRYKDAMQHFQSIPADTGFYLKKYSVIVSKTPISIEEARDFMFEAAAQQLDLKGLTWHRGPFNAMGMDDASIHLTSYTLPHNAPKFVKDYANYMQAIAGAEEIAHALQGMYGMYISPRMRQQYNFAMNPQLTDSQNHAEHDIAQHFIDRKIPVPNGFMEKYNRSNYVVGEPTILTQYPIID